MIGKLLSRMFRFESAAQKLSRLLELARQQLAAGAPAQAAAAYRELLQIAPGHIDALCALGAIESEQGRVAEALEIASRLSLLEPDNADHPMRAALFQSQLGRRDEASLLYRRAIEIGNNKGEDTRQAYALLSGLELPGEAYFRLLARFHRHLRPRSYLEIGVFKGLSIALAGPETIAIGVDPHPQIEAALGANMHIHAATSDDYFARHDVRAELGGLPLDLAFIDGMHNFEFALHDFINIERLCTPESVILIHDCYPLDRLSAGRERKTEFWSGDIWRMLLLLRQHRPDLQVRTIAVKPTGLGMITGLDPHSRVLSGRIEELIAEYLALDFAELERDKDGMLNRFPNDWEKIRACLPAPFRAAAP